VKFSRFTVSTVADRTSSPLPVLTAIFYLHVALLALVKDGVTVMWYHRLQWPREPQYSRWNRVCSCWVQTDITTSGFGRHLAPPY